MACLKKHRTNWPRRIDLHQSHFKEGRRQRDPQGNTQNGIEGLGGRRRSKIK